MPVITRDYYLKDALELAPLLLGKILVHELPQGRVSARIVETEAYMGAMDKASHSYGNKRTPRTEIQFEAGGLAYVYLIYGMYSCMNIVTAAQGTPQCVLLRALQPLEGADIMYAHRTKAQRHTQLCSGPGKLCQAMGITRACNGLNLSASRLYLEDAPDLSACEIETDVRINIDYAQEAAAYPWRFYIKGNEHVSAVKKRSH